MTSENGSMEKSLIKFAVEHVNKYARQLIPENITFCLTLDGHSSREGWEWLERCREMNCAVVQAPSSISHFLQLCDQLVNKDFQLEVRRMRDVLVKSTHTEIRTVRCGLMAGVAAYQSITLNSIRTSFAKKGLWPMDFRFLNNLRAKLKQEDVKSGIQHASIASQMPSVSKRVADKNTFDEIKTVLSGSQYPSSALKYVEMLLHKRITVNCILMQVAKPKPDPTAAVKTAKNGALISGTPAYYLTVDSAIEMRKAKDAEAEKLRLNKELQKKQKEVEKAKKRAQKEHVALEKRKARALKKRQREAAAASKRQLKRVRTDCIKGGEEGPKVANLEGDAAEALLSLHANSAFPN